MNKLSFVGVFSSLGLLCGVVSYGGGIDALISSFRVADISYLLIAAIFYFLMLVLFAFRWKTFSVASGVTSNIKIFVKLQIIGHWISTITPFFMSGGEPVKAYLLAKYSKTKKSKTLATLVHPWFFDLGSFLLMDLFVLIFIVFFVKKTLFEHVLVSAIFVSVVITGFLFYAVFNEKRAYKIADKFLLLFNRFDFLKEKIANIRIKLKEDVRIFSNTLRNNMNFKLILWNILLTVVLRFSELVRLYFVLFAFGESVGISYLIIAITFARLSVFVPGLPGGIGAVEAGFVSGLILGGITLPVAVSVAIADRVLSFGILAIFGVLSLHSLKLTTKDATTI